MLLLLLSTQTLRLRQVGWDGGMGGPLGSVCSGRCFILCRARRRRWRLQKLFAAQVRANPNARHCLLPKLHVYTGRRFCTVYERHSGAVVCLSVRGVPAAAAADWPVPGWQHRPGEERVAALPPSQQGQDCGGGGAPACCFSFFGALSPLLLILVLGERRSGRVLSGATDRPVCFCLLSFFFLNWEQ